MSDKGALFLTLIIIFWGAIPVLSAAETGPKEAMMSPGNTAGSKQGMGPVHSEAVSSPSATSGTENDTQGVGSAVQMAQGEVRDPFQSQLKAAADAGEPIAKANQVITVILEGVGLGSQNAYAVLNGDIYSIDDDKKGIKLLAVRKGEADVFVNGVTQTLRLVDEAAIKKAVEGRRKILGTS